MAVVPVAKIETWLGREAVLADITDHDTAEGASSNRIPTLSTALNHSPNSARRLGPLSW